MMDGSFHAIATLLHLVPRDPSRPAGKPKPGSPRQVDRLYGPHEVRDGWIRVAL